MKVRCIKDVGTNFFVGKVYEINENGFMGEDAHFKDFLDFDGETLLDKWHNWDGEHSEFEIVDEEVFVESDVEVIPRSFEIKCGTCTADLWRDEIDFGNYDVENIEDIIKVATKAKELYDEYYAKEE